MTDKTIEQLKDEMLHKMFEEVCKANHGNTDSDFVKDEDGDYERLDLQIGFAFFCEGRTLSDLANVVNPKTGLKACPFCAAEAERYPDGDMEGYSVMCSGWVKNEEWSLKDNTRHVCPMGIFGYKSQEDADASWNTRA